MRRIGLGFLSVVCGALAAQASAQTRLPAQALSSYGMPGLIDMPTATSMPDGTLAFTVQAMNGTQRVTLAFQALPRVTLSLRYAAIDRVSGGRLFDRSFDLHWRVMDEGRFTPAIAVGLRDFIGTGAYSSEYIVASRTLTPRLRASLGIGWGRLATHGSFENPLAGIHSGFRTRPGFSGEGGEVELNRFFRGPAAFFAGAEYQATDRLTILAEYSSDDYNRDLVREDYRTPLNLGFRYQMSRGRTVSGYLLHGSTIGLTASFALNPAQPSTGGVRVSAPLPVLRRDAPTDPGGFSTSWSERADAYGSRFIEVVGPVMATEGVRLDGVEFEARRAVVRVTNQRHEVLPRALGRTARILSHSLPPSVEEIVLIPMHDGVAGTAVTLRRSDLERYEHDPDGPERLLSGARFSDPLGFPGVGRLWQPLPQGRQRLEWSVGPYLAASLFDPTSPVRVDVGLRADLRFQFAENLSLNGRFLQRIAGNIEGNRFSDPTPGYPRVRSHGYLYSSDRPTVDRLTADYTFRPAQNLFGRLTVGWLERMYAGVSTELLWSPPNSRLAFGVELNRVAQRDPEALLGVNALRLNTGHVSAYYDFGRGYHAQVDVGQYLAGDRGATLRLERVFGSGLRVGAYATLTDMPFDVFGEGSFDKGITISIPLTTFLGVPSRNVSSADLQSLARDGGARLRVPGALYPTIQQSRSEALRRSWGAVLQ
jgi:hypothetical protein